MSKKTRIWRLIVLGVIVIIAGVWIGNYFKPQPAKIDLSLSPALEIKDALTQAYIAEDTILCIHTTNIDTLSAILVDTGDYTPTFQEIKTIVQIFGPEGLTHAGF